jgi:hypothetical protein
VRHSIIISEKDIADEVKTIHERLPRMVKKLKENPLSIVQAIASDLQFLAISDSIVLHRSESETYEHLYYTLQFGINHFKLAINPGKTVELNIGNSTLVDATGFETNDFIAATNWQTCFYIASILRDTTSLDFLRTVPKSFMEKSVIIAGEIDYAVVDVLKAMSAKQGLNEAIKKFHETRQRTKYESILRENFDNHLTLPLISVIEALNVADAKIFNERLKDALAKHHDFYKEEKEGMGLPYDRFGWISFMLIAVCSYAHDRGIKIEIESDYLPMWLVRGDFKGLKLTVN